MTAGASLVMVKLGSVTHGWDNGQRLTDLKFSQDLDKGEVTFTAPTNRHTNPPGYYMLFYVNAKGKPSRAAWRDTTWLTVGFFLKTFQLIG